MAEYDNTATKPTDRRFLDFTGKVIGRLTVMSYAGRSPRNTGGWNHYWECDCSCGSKKVIIPHHSLKAGYTFSCGCFNREQTRKALTTHGHNPTTGPTPEYKAYLNTFKRCKDDPESRWYKYYAARGIRVLYKSFEEFLADVGFRPTKKHSLDRINNNGHYKPGNCRWALKPVQFKNSRNPFGRGGGVS